ncbi:gag-pol polyprotein [Tanacetum coccineum]
MVPSTESKLELIHMDLCAPMRVESINGKKYILVIVDDYSRYTKAEAIDTACFTHNRSLVHTRYNKTPYELIRGRKPNVLYFHVFGSLCYLTNDRDDLGKMKPKADIEYYVPSTFEVSDNFVAKTLDVEDTLSPSSFIFEDSDALQIVTSSEEPIIKELSIPVLDTHFDEKLQEDVVELDENTIMHSFKNPKFKEAESSSNYQDLSNMYEFHQKHRYTNKWTKNHPIEQVIVSLTEPKNIKEAMLDHSWIKSIQDELNQFKRLEVWELVSLPEGRHAIKVKWLWKNKTDAENIVIRNKSRLVAKSYSQQEGIDF